MVPKPIESPPKPIESPPKPSFIYDLFWDFEKIEEGSFPPQFAKSRPECAQSDAMKSTANSVEFRLLVKKVADRNNVLLEVSKPPGLMLFKVSGDLRKRNCYGVLDASPDDLDDFVQKSENSLKTHTNCPLFAVESDDPLIWEVSSTSAKLNLFVPDKAFKGYLRVVLLLHQITSDGILKRLVVGDESFSDLLIKVGDVEIKAHKCILGMHSGYFKRIFEQTNQEEVHNGTFLVKEFSPPAIKAMVNFLYARVDHEELGKNVGEVLAVADKYEIQSLKDYASGLLESVVEEVPVPVAELAHRFNVPYLLQMCVNHVEKNFEETKKSETWRTLVNRNQDVLHILTGQDVNIAELIAKAHS